MGLSSGLTDVNYKTGPFDCKASYDFYKGDLTACASGTFSGVTLGAECGYSTTKSALSKYTAACQYVQPDFTVSAKMAEVMKTPGSVFSGAYYHKVSAEMQVGAEIKKAASKSDVDLAFGCLYKLDKTTTVKGKVDSDGKLFASFKQQLSPLTLLTLVSEVDTVNLNEGKSGLLSSGVTDLNYKSGPFDCKAAYDFYKGDLTACASGTFSGVTLGAECGYSTTKSALSKYAAACQYVQPDFTVSAKMAEVIKTPGSVFSGAYYHKVSAEMQV